LTNNEILKKLKDILNADATKLKEIYDLVDYEITNERIEGYLKEKSDKEFLDCGSEALGNLLDAIIIYKRGPSDKNPTKEQVVQLTNNLILKKLRVAFELKEIDLYEIFNTVEIDITKGELSSLFRNENHKKFKSCPDSILELFLEGLYICETQMHQES
jgi:uncharacterized protein YehS (DUF1456 family)